MIINLSTKQNQKLSRIVISMLMFFLLFILNRTEIITENNYKGLFVLALYIVAYFIAGYDVVKKCFWGIFHGQIMDENFLMTLATVGAFVSGQFGEAVAVMLFYQVGEFFQDYAVGKSRAAVKELMSIAPEYANLQNDDGSIDIIDPDDIEVGDILIIKPGEKIPIDGIVVEGEGLINTSALTGESMPHFVETGNEIISGCINGDNLLKVQADREYEDSTVVRILELVETAANKKSRTENFITRFARYYTPVVVVSALLISFVPPIFLGNLMDWVLRGCTFLVISCPCALVISVPMAFFGGIGAASKSGMLVKGSNFLEIMANVDTIVFDKTGTLTEGKFEVKMINAMEGYTVEEVIKYAAAAESGSTHPIATPIISACKKPFRISKISDLENIRGRGITAKVGKNRIIVGSRRLMQEKGIVLYLDEPEDTGITVYVAKDEQYIGSIVLVDSLKKHSKEAIRNIISEGVKHIVMLTGDTKKNAAQTASELGFKDYKSDLLPQDKVKIIEDIIEDVGLRNKDKSSRKKVVFVGDGINDAPVLSRADAGIALGSMGSDAAIEAADIVIMDDNLERIPSLIRIARKTVDISKANIVFALVVKIAFLIMGGFGIANMWMAVIADVGVAILCILNSMRMLVVK
ncbi:MAG: cadmium-translocating P-type ATPase [Clostridiales bacterium]|nr:cadmium-translocating P-type ATPase [Clostridiales bacterium]